MFNREEKTNFLKMEKKKKIILLSLPALMLYNWVAMRYKPDR